MTPIDKLFGIKRSPATKNGLGETIEANVLPARTDGTEKFMARIKPEYVFHLETLIDVLIAYEENIPMLLWGPHGSGKSTMFQQVASRLNRPSIRLQHSVDTEKADIWGQWVLVGDRTEFMLGPLARAMRDGLIYIADEYDFALPNVLSAYQAVLEGEALIIANAPPELAVIEPHPDFRFMATGNTNGGGDETGLYQGTQLQNAANYSRFGITVKLNYSPEESAMLRADYAGIPEEDIKLLMQFVTLVRKAYDNRTIGNILSTRELKNVLRLAILRGRDKPNFRYAVQRGFANRLGSVDSNAVMGIVDKVFGK